MYHLVKNASYYHTFSWGKCYITIVTVLPIQARKIRCSDGPGQPIFSFGQANHDLFTQWLNISKGKHCLRHGPHSNPKSAIMIVLAGMTYMIFIPCILVQDKAETRLNRKQY